MATAQIDDEAAAKATDHKKGTGRLQCVVVTPERTLIDEVVGFVAIPLYDGELGVLPGRAPLIGRLGYGELRVELQDVAQRYFIDGGFVQIRDDVVTVLTPRAIPAARIDVALAAAELERAQAMPAATDAQIADKERAIARARAQSRVASHAHHS
jgi:F-type H+-transporting ATPase subunit epsilon